MAYSMAESGRCEVIQYRVIENATGKLIGYLVGKTPNRELVVNLGNRTFLIPITAETNAKYRVDAVRAGTK